MSDHRREDDARRVEEAHRLADDRRRDDDARRREDIHTRLNDGHLRREDERRQTDERIRRERMAVDEQSRRQRVQAVEARRREEEQTRLRRSNDSMGDASRAGVGGGVSRPVDGVVRAGGGISDEVQRREWELKEKQARDVELARRERMKAELRRVEEERRKATMQRDDPNRSRPLPPVDTPRPIQGFSKATPTTQGPNHHSATSSNPTRSMPTNPGGFSSDRGGSTSGRR